MGGTATGVATAGAAVRGAGFVMVPAVVADGGAGAGVATAGGAT